MMRFIFALFILLVAVPAVAQDHLVAVDLAEDHIDITTGFNGAKLILFGVQEQPGEIAIVFSGPRKDMVVRRKEKVSGIWMNRTGMNFEDVPVYYDFAVANVEKPVASEDVLKQEMIGLSALRFESVDTKKDKKDLAQFQDALIRTRQKEGFVPEKPENIIFINDHFFRTTFYLPPNVPTGDYQIKTFLMSDGKVRGVKTMDVRVGQVGMSANIFKFAHEHEIIYGLFCVIFAMTIGWFSNAIRRQT